jgi:hypothetical protein
MAGLIQQQMQPGAGMPPGGAPVEDPAMQDPAMQDPAMQDPAMQDPAMQDPAAMQDPSMQGEMENEELADTESSEPFQLAMQYAMEALYSNKAATDVAQALKAAPDPVEGLANTAYEMTSVVDERTDGQVPDELIIPLAMQILEEVVEIAEAAGVEFQPSDVAGAFKQMLLRFLGEQGVDTTQLQQAMDQVDPEAFNQAAAADEEA